MNDFLKYIIARWAYSVGQPIMTDAEYTMLDRAMKATHADSPYCNRSWSSDPCPTAILHEYGYDNLIKAVVLSDKTESIPSLNTDYEVQQEYGMMHSPHSVSFKLDGWNIQASYYNGSLINIQTRGRSTDSMDANVLSKKFPATIPEMGKVLVVTECTVPDAEFAWFKRNFNVTSQRGAVSTAIANPLLCLDHIAVHAHGLRRSSPVVDKFATLQSWGFETPMHSTVNNYQELLEQIKAFSEYKEAYGIPTDGLVVEGASTKAIRIAGWEEPIYRSYVQGYTETYGPHSIAVQALIYPIKLRNSVQKQLPVTNLRRVLTLNLRPGFPIAFRVASSAISVVDEDATRLLQKEWQGRESEYQTMIKMNEAYKDN